MEEERSMDENEELYEEDYSPCEMCMSRRCSHCRYGDDGNYSIYDVYSPAELGISVSYW